MHPNYINFCKIINSVIMRQFIASVNISVSKENIEQRISHNTQYASYKITKYSIHSTAHNFIYTKSINPSQLHSCNKWALPTFYLSCSVLLSEEDLQDIHSLWGNCSKTFLINRFIYLISYSVIYNIYHSAKLVQGYWCRSYLPKLKIRDKWLFNYFFMVADVMDVMC